MSVRFLSDQCVPAEITDRPQRMQRLLEFLDTHPEQEYYRGMLFLAEAHRIRIRQ